MRIFCIVSKTFPSSNLDIVNIMYTRHMIAMVCRKIFPSELGNFAKSIIMSIYVAKSAEEYLRHISMQSED